VPVVQQRPQPAYQQQPPQQQQQQQLHAAGSPWGAPAPAQSYSTPAAAAAPAAADAALRWRHCFSSEPEDHDKKAVTALAYAQTLPGLPGGDGHAGWLVSGAGCCWPTRHGGPVLAAQAQGRTENIAEHSGKGTAMYGWTVS
jgi:hypothetical protein